MITATRNLFLILLFVMLIAFAHAFAVTVLIQQALRLSSIPVHSSQSWTDTTS
jgi:hypothetical protein